VNRRLRVLGICSLLCTIASGAAAQTLEFGSDGAVVFTRVHLDKIAEFESILDQTHELLKKSDNPIRRQQAEAWKVFRTTDQAAGEIAIYVSVITPVVKSADYSLTTIFDEELSEKDAKSLTARFQGCLAAPQFAYSIDPVALVVPEPASSKVRRASAKSKGQP
jgi:hypothetical protein